MSTYVLSDIHGEYDMFIDILEKINLQDEDTLYVLGDVVDRGPNPVKTLLKLMEMPNAICIVGNHEVMAVECLTFLKKEITDRSLEELDYKTLDNLITWQNKGGKSTIYEFCELDSEMQNEIIDFIKDFSLYEEVRVNSQKYLLVHAGLGNFDPKKDLNAYSLNDFVWERADYEITYFNDTVLISGHTPTQYIENNQKPGYVYKKNNHMAIDCGSYIKNGRIAAVCLETKEEFYSYPNENGMTEET